MYEESDGTLSTVQRYKKIKKRIENEPRVLESSDDESFSDYKTKKPKKGIKRSKTTKKQLSNLPSKKFNAQYSKGEDEFSDASSAPKNSEHSKQQSPNLPPKIPKAHCSKDKDEFSNALSSLAKNDRGFKIRTANNSEHLKQQSPHLPPKETKAHRSKDGNEFFNVSSKTLTLDKNDREHSKQHDDIDLSTIFNDNASLLIVLQKTEGLISKDLLFLFVAMKKLTIEVKDLRHDVHSLRAYLQRNGPANNKPPYVNFLKKYNFEKISSLLEFDTFDDELKNNKEFKEDCKNFMTQQIDSQNIKLSILNVTKAILHRDFAMNCTTIKSCGKKKVLLGTEFYEIFFQIIHENFDNNNEKMTDKVFYQSLSTCLSNSKDWDGHRHKRPTKKLKD